jgi:hypothetical protein
MIAGKCFSFASRARLCRFAQPGRAARHRAFASDAGLVLLGLGRGARPCKEKPRAGRGELSMTKASEGSDTETSYPGRCPGVYAVSPNKDHRAASIGSMGS